ncbi:hypothetical protein NUW54_g10854 [Trametes sanguinea]|uniref:Uncharacterized protein n=1 Tax=Trametes sanguinea TaxID=158606 RepID=A0ACC1NSU6_9APHY|nr:hypothetical protein NUW54_g10854 [Trametes sanguinea]
MVHIRHAPLVPPPVPACTLTYSTDHHSVCNNDEPPLSSAATARLEHGTTTTPKGTRGVCDYGNIRCSQEYSTGAADSEHGTLRLCRRLYGTPDVVE